MSETSSTLVALTMARDFSTMPCKSKPDARQKIYQVSLFSLKIWHGRQARSRRSCEVADHESLQLPPRTVAAFVKCDAERLPYPCHPQTMPSTTSGALNCHERFNMRAQGSFAYQRSQTRLRVWSLGCGEAGLEHWRLVLAYFAICVKLHRVTTSMGSTTICSSYCGDTNSLIVTRVHTMNLHGYQRN